MSKVEEVSVLNYPDIGMVYFRKSRKARYVRISINHEKRIRVTVPKTVSLKAAEGFLMSKKEWVIRHLNQRKESVSKTLVYTHESECYSRMHEFRFVWNGVEKPGFKIIQNTVYIYIPEKVSIEDQLVQDTIRKSFIETWRKEAKILLIPRTFELAGLHGFKINKVSVKNAITRWGSCSHKNNINLSLHLIRLPDHLVDYVILHELVHTKIKNHQAGFWEALDNLTGNAKELRKQMKKYHLNY